MCESTHTDTRRGVNVNNLCYMGISKFGPTDVITVTPQKRFNAENNGRGLNPLFFNTP